MKPGPAIQPTTENEQKLFDIKDSVAYLERLGARGVTVNFVRTLIVSGQLAHVPIGKKFFVTKAALDGWVARAERKRSAR